MPITDAASDLIAFHQFVGERIEQGALQLTPEEVLIEWQMRHDEPDLHARNVAAVRAALCDMEAGDRGIPAEESLRQLRDRLAVKGSR
jgi:hypothetical protein